MCREAEFIPTSAREEDRSIDVVWSTGAEVRRFDWWSGDVWWESLAMTPEACRLERLNRGAPVLMDHNPRDQIGKVVEGSARIEGGKGIARLRFSRRADVTPLWEDIRDGIRTKFSVGYDVLKYDEEFKDGKIFRRTAVLWEPAEISSVSMPADIGAEARDKAPRNPCIFTRSQSSAPSQRGTMKMKALKTRMSSEEKVNAIVEILGDASYDLDTEEGRKAAAMAIVLKLQEESAAESPAEESSDEMAQITEAARSLTGKKRAPEVIGALRALKDARESLAQQKAENSALAERVAQLEARNTEAEVAALIDGAVKEGKLTPALRSWARGLVLKEEPQEDGSTKVKVIPGGLAQLRSYLEFAVPVGPGQRDALPPTNQAANPPQDKDPEPTPEMRAYCERNQLDPKAFARKWQEKYPGVRFVDEM